MFETRGGTASAIPPFFPKNPVDAGAPAIDQRLRGSGRPVDEVWRGTRPRQPAVPFPRNALRGGGPALDDWRETLQT
ncbi:MAG: hypothetical protein AB7H86_02025 [Blastocatellales bacterium]